MRVPFATFCAVCCAGLAGSAAGAEAGSSGWYFSAGAGIALNSGMDQVGWNEDTVCYPTDACFAADPVPSVPGYRWRYAIDADAGSGLEITLGRQLGRSRIEFSAAQSRNNIEQNFVSIEYLDGSPRVPRDGPVVADSATSMDDIVARFASLSVYRDFSVPNSRLIPYVGIGLGTAFMKVRGLRFSSDYRDTSQPPLAYDPPLSFYGGRQNVDHSDAVLVGHLHAGADYEVNDQTLIGAKLTCSLIDDTADAGVYSRHPMHAHDPGFTNQNTFDATRNCSLAVTLKRRLGR